MRLRPILCVFVTLFVIYGQPPPGQSSPLPSAQDASAVAAESADQTGADNYEKMGGLVAAVSLETSAGPKSLFSTTVDISEKDPGSTVQMELDGSPDKEFRILVSEIVELVGFKDLKGRHLAMGGLFILSDLQEKLTGKNVTFQCRKLGVEDERELYHVKDVKILDTQP